MVIGVYVGNAEVMVVVIEEMEFILVKMVLHLYVVIRVIAACKLYFNHKHIRHEYNDRCVYGFKIYFICNIKITLKKI